MASVLPRWADKLNQVLAENMATNEAAISFALTSLDVSLPSPAPRVRFVVHRGFLNERRPSEPSAWSTNASHDAAGHAFVSTNMLVTTDVRGPKAAQISQRTAVELAWWFKDTMHQFRIRAHAWILPAPEHPLRATFPAERLAPPGLPQFDWESERLRIFRKMSPGLRASFCRPIPGTPLASTDPPVDPAQFPTSLPSDLDATTDEEKRLVGEALEAFSLIVMSPFYVDLCDLGARPNTRSRWELGKTGQWTKTDLVP